MIIATELIYLLAAVLFILGLQFLSSPHSARRGNWIAASGMVLAVAWTVVLLRDSFTTAGIIICIVGVVIGSIVGVVSARTVKMTAMPQMVAIFNGAGGGAAALVGVSALLRLAGQHLEFQTGFPEVFAVIIGGISFAGSVIAFSKLQELITGAPITYPGQHLLNALLALVILALAAVLLVVNSSIVAVTVLLALVLVLGRHLCFADRRGRHAGCDLDAKRVYRPGCCGQWVRTQQLRVDCSRNAGWRFGYSVDQKDERCYGPLVGQCSVRCFRPGSCQR
jgi:NAD(P) transhydrogenase subunit beta